MPEQVRHDELVGIMRHWFAIPLWQRVLGALALGLVFALVWPSATPAVAFMGDLFVRAIRMIGAMLLHPGVGAPLGTAAPHPLGPPVTAYDQMIGSVPLNIVDALAKGDMLALIFVAIMIGVATVVAGEPGKPFASLLQSTSSVLLKLVTIVMEATPFGVFALLANAVAANGAAVFVHVGWLALAVVIGSLIQMVVVHSLLLRLVARLPMLPFVHGIIDALVVGFSTASSGAALPVGMRVAGENLGVARPVYSTARPLGASIGKDGTVRV